MVEYTGWKPALTAALSKIGETIAVEQIALTAPLAYTLPAGTPSGVVHSVVFTQNNVGGHTVTYGPDTLAIDTDPGASTLVEIWPNGRIVYPGATDALTPGDIGAQPINAQTGTTYTLQASDAGKLVTLTNAAAITLTVPGNVFTAGQRVDCLVAGAGMVTATAGSGLTLNGTPTLVSRAQYSAFTVLFTSTTAAVVVGDLASS